MLLESGAGFGALALAGMLPGTANADSATAEISPMAPKLTSQAASAKSVIFLFMEGGPSQMDTFDPKPELQRLAGQSIPASFELGILAATRRLRMHRFVPVLLLTAACATTGSGTEKRFKRKTSC